MARLLHSLLGLGAALIVMVVAATGAWLALDALGQRAAAPPTPAGASVASLARAAAALPGVERIDRKPSGAIVVTWFENDRAAQALIDPASGAIAPAPEASPLMAGVRNLHRRLLSGEGGRLAVGAAALAMLALNLSGLVMLARRLGGWRRLFAPSRGGFIHRLHCDIARFAVVGLTLSALTGVVMTATSFELAPDPGRARAESATSSEGPRVAVADLALLKATPLSDFRSLQFPAANDPTDVYTLATATGETTLDAASGAVLTQATNGAWTQIYQVIYALHAGELAWPVTLLLALSSAAAPVLAVAGALIWIARRRAQPRRARGVGAQSADTILLVGSEGGATWGFADTLRAGLAAQGFKVHVAAMNDLAPAYRSARRLIVLAATYGEGDAPASARRFLARLESWRGGALDAFVLGFGDRQFPAYCAYAERVAQALLAQGLNALALDRIDRQSAQAFANWGRGLGRALGTELELRHVPVAPKTSELELVDRVDYGREVGAPTVVLRFSAAKGARLPRFEAGDLIGVTPPGETVARFYSLASSRRDGFVEICVRKLEGGVCSQRLHALMPGERIDVFVRENPAFRPAPGREPVILIGAGAGVAPLAGFIRGNARQRPIWLYFGARHRASDFLYEEELRAALADKRLHALRPAFSREPGRHFVQTRLLADAEALRALIAAKAQILVCGGREMAQGVGEALAHVLAPLGLTVADLKREGRYVEDVY